MVAAALLLALTLATAPAPQAEEPPPALEEPAAPLPAAHRVGILAAAGWCVLKTDSREDRADDLRDLPGCDLGMGVKLLGLGHPRLSWVGVIGTQTVGTGVALRVLGGDGTPVVAVAVGVVVHYDETGVDATEVLPAVGATLTFARP